MSINGSPSPPLSPVHNNFDSRIIIAFLKQVSPKKIYYPGTTISNRFFLRIGESFVFFLSQLRPLLLYFLFFSFFRFRLIVKFFFFSLFPSPRHDFTTLSLLSAVSTLDYIFLRSSPRSFPFPILLFHHNFLSFAVPRSKLSIYSCKVRSKDSTPFEPHLFTFHPFYHPLHFPFPTRSRKREIEQIFNPRKNSPMPVTRFVKIQSGEHVPRFRKETDIFSSNPLFSKIHLTAPHHSSGSQSNRPANFGPRPEIVSF